MTLEKNVKNIYKVFFLIIIEHVHNLKLRKYKNDKTICKVVFFFLSLLAGKCL